MSEIDWQADLEKKVANLVRKFAAEVRAHGDEDVLLDKPRWWTDREVKGVNGTLIIIDVFAVPPKSEKQFKKKVTDESSGETDGDATGDD